MQSAFLSIIQAHIYTKVCQTLFSCYLDWAHPNVLGEEAIELFLSHLANQQNVTTNTQAQAFSDRCRRFNGLINAKAKHNTFT
ncbi:phage integrase N-terminal SAM-like domain-containing protein [Pseudoalteromonas sp. SMS1]|uniref:phage integrase N-terminal SAM-like domain-containing protein n=1 Tax=Pseudoalteromonas sp. SMS1 TaxID=2908894 RepID=UPI001F44D762|nr:phage integrase N-terminal SAM-like domain-containing protein [Pseudoalteromonas sp. SMS1]MCF2859177.1 phage integrase N-terminal SAM-like domain-containing protein [Pseudoalteromonas sp. SMS1]